MAKGVVKSYDRGRGRGVIEPVSGEEDVPFDRTALSKLWRGESPQPGREVGFKLVEDEKGSRAVNVVLG